MKNKVSPSVSEHSGRDNKMVSEQREFNDIKPFKHGQEGTHGACKEMFDKLGGKVGCCECNGHKCSPQPLQPGTRTLKQTLKTIENIRSLENKEGEDLDQSIKKIRHSWGEISEYCQDEIIDFVDSYIDKEKQRTVLSIIDYIEDTLILLGIEHAGSRMKGEWINKDELVEFIKSKYLKNK